MNVLKGMSYVWLAVALFAAFLHNEKFCYFAFGVSITCMIGDTIVGEIRKIGVK